MRITDVTVTPVAFRDPALLNSAGVHEPYALRAIVEVTTDAGLTGLGETTGDENLLRLLGSAAGAAVGGDPFDLLGLERRVAAAVGGQDSPDAHGLTGPSSAAKSLARAFSPIEVACLDLQGRATGQPVWALLGGKARERVPFSAYLFYKWATHPGSPYPDEEADPWNEALNPAGIVAQARRMVDLYGFRSIKLKGGVMPPEEEIEAIRALREAFPGHPLRLDPNCAWTVETSHKVAEALDGALEYLEDPTPSIPGMAQVAARAPMPLATNMCVVGFADLPESLALGAVDVVLSDHHYWGGLRASQRLAAVCDTFGLGLSMHSNSHLGISLAAMVHLAAATPNLTYDVDTHWPWRSEDVVADNPYVFSGGSIAVPDTPGLGIELDRDELARLHEQYLRCGIRSRNDTAYMKRFRPEYEKRRPRW
ncbi:glucarate dehydratase family protein [Streptomyces sp. HYC2]|uniref:glucarate dehydratase family protein n=1 Tax=Streptomyces sp. HYC2 TaxID=2955207 RepID=UPI002480598E|nr:glucarate dehydratase family protein [Streptomyces sp. HYC2]